MTAWIGNWERATVRLAHAVAVPVTPAVGLASSSIAAATVITTLTPHWFVSGDTVLIAGHVGSTPDLNGSGIVTVLSSLTFSIPLTVTIAGTGGTVTRTLPREPLTLAEGKLRAELDWPDGGPRDALMLGWIASARSQVEKDTGMALLLKSFDVYYDALPSLRTPVALPWRPVASLTSVSSIDTAGVSHILDVSNYELDPSSAAPVSARVALSTIGAWPTDLRPFQPYVLRIVAGYPSVAALTAAAPELLDAIGILVAHAATAGRDRFTESRTRDEYLEKIAPYVLVSLA
jgi:uncharacterized phiE125 gp8 family phage protein